MAVTAGFVVVCVKQESVVSAVCAKPNVCRISAYAAGNVSIQRRTHGIVGGVVKRVHQASDAPKEGA